MAKNKEQDSAELKEKVIKIFDDSQNPIRKIMERIWFRNILYYIGEQYIEWVISLNTFRRKPTHPFIPTPVANIIRDYVRSMKALILNKDFTIRIWPNSNEQTDREAALLGENLLKWMDLDQDEEFKDEKEKAVIWTILTGVGFIRTFPMLDRGEMAISKTGEIIKTGEVVSENVIPFNIYVDDLGDSLKKKTYAGIKSLKPREWVEDVFKTKIKGGEETDSINYQRRLMRMLGSVSPWKTSGLESQMMDMKSEDLVIFKEVEFKPISKRPKGRYVVSVGQEILLDSDSLPIPMEKDKWYYSLTDLHYQYVPGRFWSDSGVNDLISPQNSINAIDQALEINRKGLGRPLVIIPTDVNLKRVSSWGQSILAVQYDSLLAGGQRPIIERGTALPNQVLDEREVHKMTSQDAAGDPKHVLRGKAPTSSASGIMVDILRETAEQGHVPDIMRIYRSLKRVYKKRLILAQKLYSEKRMIKIAGKGTDVRVVAFKGADLRNNTDVRLELASGLSTTKAGQTRTIMELVGQGVFGNLEADPETRQEILRRLGLSGFKDKINVDVERAEKENVKMMNGDIKNIYLMADTGQGKPMTVNPDPLFKYDNHTIHYEVHRRFILSNEFETLSEDNQTILVAHTDIHVMKMMQEMEKMREQGEETGAPGELSNVKGTKSGVQESGAYGA